MKKKTDAHRGAAHGALFEERMSERVHLVPPLSKNPRRPLHLPVDKLLREHSADKAGA